MSVAYQQAWNSSIEDPDPFWRDAVRKLVNNEPVATPPTIEDAAVVPMIADVLANRDD